MDLRQIKYFVEVEEQGSLTAAADKLNIAQPSLSRQIRMLEFELGLPLFIRNGRGVVPTEAGKILAERGREILRQVHLLRDALAQTRKGTAGHVAIGIPSSLISILGVALVTGFRKKLPEVSISISDALSITMQDWISGGRLDIGLIYKPTTSIGISTIPILEEELLLFSHVSRKGPATDIALRNIADIPLILPRHPHEIRVLVDSRMDAIGVKPRIVLEVDSIPAILHFLNSGDQCSILPRYAVSVYGRLSDYVARRIVDPPLYSKLVLATSSKKPAGPVQDLALKLIADICGETLQPLKMPKRMEM